MFPSSAIRSLNNFTHLRNLSSCFVLNNSKAVSQPMVKLINVKKGSKKKARKSHMVLKRVSEDIEAMWIENLNISNLKLYRKTSFGSYRIVNLHNLFEKLREIYPNTFGEHKRSSVQIADKENCSPQIPVKEYSPPVSPEPRPVGDHIKGVPCLPEYLIKNLLEFPLLKSQESSLRAFAEKEVEEYGAIDAVTFPSVTVILNETMSYTTRLRLKQWKEKMIAELGEEGFAKYQEDLLSEGSKFHATIKTYLQVPDKALVKVPPELEGCWKSLEKLFPELRDVQFVEEPIHHPILMYKGIVDCVATYRGTPCVIEWKKCLKAKRDLQSTFDAPVQLCAYLGALVWHKNVTVTNGLVVVAYKDGSPANVFELSAESCQNYWVEWLKRVQSYWLKKSTKVTLDESNT